MERLEFERLALEHLDQVYRMAYQLTRNAEQAEELVQEVYLRAFKPGAAERFELRTQSQRTPSTAAVSSTTAPEGLGAGLDFVWQPGAPDRSSSDSVRAWLFTIVHNTFYSMIKRRRQEHSGAADPELSSQSSGVATGSPEPMPDEPPPAWDLSKLDWDHVDTKLRHAIDDLRPEFRQVLLLWGVHGMKYRQIAAMLEVPIGTVMSRLYRARKNLADVLGRPNEAGSNTGLRVAGAAGLEQS